MAEPQAAPTLIRTSRLRIALDLNRSQMEVLERLCAARGGLVTHEMLQTRPVRWRGPTSDIDKVIVSQLRKRLGPDSITTVRGLGYQASPELMAYWDEVASSRT